MSKPFIIPSNTYQRPHKVSKSIHTSLHNGDSYSTVVMKIIETHGLLDDAGLISLRFEATEIFIPDSLKKRTEKGKKTKQMMRRVIAQAVPPPRTETLQTYSVVTLFFEQKKGQLAHITSQASLSIILLSNYGHTDNIASPISLLFKANASPTFCRVIAAPYFYSNGNSPSRKSPKHPEPRSKIASQ